MKVVLASLSVLLLVAGAAAFVLLNETENARGYVSDSVPNGLEEQVRSSVNDLADAVRNLTEPSDGSVGDDASVGDETQPGTPEPLLEIGGTGGASVAFRSECREHARVDGSFADGEPVSVIARGVGACEGWTLVASELTYKTSWVADGFLVARAGDAPVSGTPTLVAAPASPSATATAVATGTPPPTATGTATTTATATPTSEPSATATATPTASATPTSGPSVWFGSLDGSAGDIVSARIGGVECEATTAYENDGAALYYLPIPADATCDPSAGDEVEFRINGETAPTKGVWQPGSSTELALP